MRAPICPSPTKPSVIDPAASSSSFLALLPLSSRRTPADALALVVDVGGGGRRPTGSRRRGGRARQGSSSSSGGGRIMVSRPWCARVYGFGTSSSKGVVHGMQQIRRLFYKPSRHTHTFGDDISECSVSRRPCWNFEIENRNRESHTHAAAVTGKQMEAVHPYPSKYTPCYAQAARGGQSGLPTSLRSEIGDVSIDTHITS
jgi:hypothetical protein